MIRSLFFSVLFIALAGGAVFLLFAFADEPPAPVPTEPVFAVRTVTAAVGEHAPRIALIGEAEARDSALLTSPLDTEVLKTPRREGDIVKKGNTLLELDARDLQLSLAASQSAVDDLDAQLDGIARNEITDSDRLGEMAHLLNLAEDNLRRSETLLARGVISQSALEQAEQAFRQRRLEYLAQRRQVEGYAVSRRRLQAQRAQLETEAERTGILLERARVRAPFAGKITRLHVSLGSRVARGQTLVELFDPQSLRLRVAIPNRRAGGLLAGRPAVAEIAAADGAIAAITLSSVSPQTDPGKGSVEGFFDLPGESWVVGATYEIALVLPTVPDSLAAPFDSLYTGSRVYVVDEESRARGVDCALLGATKAGGESRALLSCPAVQAGDLLIATQLPNILDGVKVSVAN